MRRILLLITDLQIGGTPTVVRELALRLSSPDVRVDVACLSTMGPVGDVLQSRGIQVTALNANRPYNIGAIVKLARLVRRERYDVVFSFLIHANVAAAIIRPLFPRTRFLQSIQTTQPNPAWHWFAQRLVHHFAEKIVVPSESVAQAAIERSRIRKSKIAIISNAIDPNNFPFREPRDPAVPAKIGFIGRLDPIKRIDDLIGAVRLLGPRVSLDVFGDGIERERLTALAAGKSVTLHGPIASPQAALSDVDVLVLPSEAEGFGLVLIEAMASGVPVIGTDVPGIRNVIDNGVTGLLVRPRSPGAISEAIRKLLDDNTLRKQLIRNARSRVVDRFAWDAVLPKYRALLTADDAASPLTPAPGSPGEGWGMGASARGGAPRTQSTDPLPNPPPEYRERE